MDGAVDQVVEVQAVQSYEVIPSAEGSDFLDYRPDGFYIPDFHEAYPHLSRFVEFAEDLAERWRV